VLLSMQTRLWCRVTVFDHDAYMIRLCIIVKLKEHYISWLCLSYRDELCFS
jgi:hypothetical protein